MEPLMKKIIYLLPLLLVGCGKQLPTEEEMIPLINNRVGAFGHEVVKLDNLQCNSYYSGTDIKDYECKATMKFSDGDSRTQYFQLSRSPKGKLKLYAVGKM